MSRGGSMTFSEFWSQISPTAGPLLGVIVGGLATYWTISGSEAKKRRQALEDAKRELRRKGILRVMRWAERLADGVCEMEAHLVYLQSDPEKAKKHFSDYKNAAYWLSKRPIPPEHRIFLPDTTESQCQTILNRLAHFEEVSTAMQKPETPTHRHPSWEEIRQSLRELHDQVFALEDDLASQFKKLYD
jgi:hypothetical protein